MTAYYDFHIHSCLSPCGDNDMTPYNVVNMARLQGLDIIALTDHNTCLNCPAAVKAGQEAGVVVVPGMELCTSEEIHVVCLFADLKSSLEFSQEIHTHIPKIENRAEIFGEQQIRDERDNIIGEEKLLLTTSTDISIDEVENILNKYGGIWFPAHLDRASYSVISSLGILPDSLSLHAAEFTRNADLEEYKNTYPILNKTKILTNSDAHYLENILPAENKLELKELSAKSVIEMLSLPE